MLRGMDFTEGLYHFNHQFTLYRLASFFKHRPPHWIDIEEQAFLAAYAECMSIHFGLPMPTWVDDKRYILDEPWDPVWYWASQDEEWVARRIEKAHPSFWNRNIIYADRNLIVI